MSWNIAHLHFLSLVFLFLTRNNQLFHRHINVWKVEFWVNSNNWEIVEQDRILADVWWNFTADSLSYARHSLSPFCLFAAHSNFSKMRGVEKRKKLKMNLSKQRYVSYYTKKKLLFLFFCKIMFSCQCTFSQKIQFRVSWCLFPRLSLSPSEI
jgi:hypothetical protein